MRTGWLPIVVLLALLVPSSCVAAKAVSFRVTTAGPARFRKLPVAWTFSCSFPEAEKVHVREGFEYWNELVGNEIFREVAACGPLPLLLLPSPRVLIAFVPGDPPDRKNLLAVTDVATFQGVPVSGVVRYYGSWADVESSTLKVSAARHEAGHLLGFSHSDLDRCLMYPKIDLVAYSKKVKDVCKPEAEEAKRYYGKGAIAWDR